MIPPSYGGVYVALLARDESELILSLNRTTGSYKLLYSVEGTKQGAYFCAYFCTKQGAYF